jgi:hypothetical protein
MVTTAVARGDLTQKITIQVEGEMSTLKGTPFLSRSFPLELNISKAPSTPWWTNSPRLHPKSRV